MLDPKQVRLEIIRPTLKAIQLWSQDAEDLLLGTALNESKLVYLVQNPSHIAKSVFQIEGPTYDDICKRIQEPRFAPLYQRILAVLHMQSLPTSVDATIGNITLATIIARLKYYLDNRAIPTGIDNLANYYVKVFNAGGAAKATDYVKLYKLYAASF